MPLQNGIRPGNFLNQSSFSLLPLQPYFIAEVRCFALFRNYRGSFVSCGRALQWCSHSFDMRALGGGASSVRTDSTMLTGDWNIIHVSFVVLCRIQDPAKYLFNLQNPEMTVKEVAESAVRETVGGSEIRPFSRARGSAPRTPRKSLCRICSTSILAQSDQPRHLVVLFISVMAMWVSLWFAAFS